MSMAKMEPLKRRIAKVIRLEE